MDEEHRCGVHGEIATAFCKVHKILLCTTCFIHNKHKVDDCKILEMRCLSSTDNLYLNVKSLEFFIKERIYVQKMEKKSLNDLHEESQKKVDVYYQDLQSKLGEMKQRTLDNLNRSFDRRNTALGVRSDVLCQSEAMVLKYMRDIDTEPDKQDIGKIKRELIRLQTTVDDHSPASLKPVECTFMPFSNIFNAKMLGDFEFSDELYETVDEWGLGQMHGNVDSGNENDKPNKSDSLQAGDVDSDTVESDDYVPVAPNIPPSISSHGEIKCESSTPPTQCVIKKIDVLPDKRVVVLDTKHQKLLLLDYDGHIIQEFVENGNSVEMVDFCAIKDKLAVLGLDDMGTFISEVVFAKNAIKSKSKTYLAGDKVQHMLQHVILFGFDTGILQNTYAIGFADRIVKYKGGKFEGVVTFLDDKLVPDPTTVQSIYDFPKGVIFILDKENGRLVRYDCKDKKAIWNFASVNESVRFLAMYQVKKDLLLLCPERILWICKDSGQVLREKDISFSKDLVSFCVDGKDVIVIYGTNGASFRMTKHPNVLIK